MPETASEADNRWFINRLYDYLYDWMWGTGKNNNNQDNFYTQTSAEELELSTSSSDETIKRPYIHDYFGEAESFGKQFKAERAVLRTTLEEKEELSDASLGNSNFEAKMIS